MKKLLLLLLVGLLAACSSNINNNQEEVLDQNNDVIDEVVIDQSQQKSKDELMKQLQSNYQIEVTSEDYQLFDDYDYNSTKELIVAKEDDNHMLKVYYISYDGKQSQIVLEADHSFEGYHVSEIALTNQKHLAINQYSELSMDKQTTIIALKDDKFEVLYQSNDALITQEQDDILFKVEAMDAMYDPSIAGYIGHSYKNSYLFYDESSSSYKEYGAKEISVDEFNQYTNAQSVIDTIVREIVTSDEQYTFKYFIRRNQIMHIQYEVGFEGSLIRYGYYTLKINDNELEIISNASGQMKEHFSNLGVVY